MDLVLLQIVSSNKMDLVLLQIVCSERQNGPGLVTDCIE